MTFNLADLWEQVAAAVPRRDALLCGPERLTYDELDQRAARVGAALADAGVGPGDRVAVALRNGVPHVEVLLGALKIGAVPVNVNYRYQRDELRHVLDDSGARVIVHEPEMSAVVDQLRVERPEVAAVVGRGGTYVAWRDTPRPPAPAVERSDDDLYVLYTGGTTGAPKGVVWRHVDVFFAAMGGGIHGGEPITRPEALAAAVSAEPHRVLPASPLTHGTAQWFTLLTLFAGGTVVLSPDLALEIPRLLDLVDAESVSYLQVVGDAITAPLVDALDAEAQRWDLGSLTVVLSGGAALSDPVRERLLEHLPWIVVVDSYGTSETGGQASTVYTPGMSGRLPARSFAPRAETLVVDDELRPVEPGSGRVGRIARRGHVPLRYLGDPALSAATFPTIAGERWALTGDEATIDDKGRILFRGRGSSTINSGGEKIHPEEVEAVLRDHPAVYDAVVVGTPDVRWGERVTAVVAPRQGAEVRIEELVEHCRGRLADFKAPRTVVLTARVERVESGKPDHRWARAVAETADAASRT